MLLSLNIIIDELERQGVAVTASANGDARFRSVALPPLEQTGGVLYVCEKPPDGDGDWICSADGSIPSDQLLCMVTDIFMRLHEWYESMQNAFLSNKGIQEIITLSEPVIGNFISVSDSAFSLVAYTRNITTDDPVSLFLIENGYHSEETYRKFVQRKRFRDWTMSVGLVVNETRDIAKHTVVSKVFTFNHSYFTHVVMSCNHRMFTPGLLDLFSIIADILERYTKRNWDAANSYSHGYNSLVSELIEGNIRDYDAVAERAYISGLNQNKQYLLMSLSESSENGAFPGRLARDIADKFLPVRPFYHGARLILFLQRENVAAFWTESGKETMLADYFKLHGGIRCGISDVFSNLLDMPVAYRQALVALEEGSPGEPITRFADVYAKYLLNIPVRKRNLVRSGQYGLILRELKESDKAHGKNDYDVLRTYLLNERRPAESADKLFMHRNNVVYRINRIEERLGISLDDELLRVNLIMTFLADEAFGIFDEDDIREKGGNWNPTC